MAHRRPPALRLPLLSLLATGLFVGGLVWLAAALLLAVAETPGGRCTALGFLLAIPALGGLPFALGSRRREPAVAAAGVLLALGALAIGWAAQIAPEGGPGPGGTLRSVYLGGGEHPRYALANLVPERDQFALGSHLMGPLDAYLDAEQTRRVRALFQRIYEEAAQDPDFAAVGSAMPWSYRELFGRSWDVGHHYVYRPPGHEGEPLPVLLFLHGWGGPFLGYQWVLKRFADARGWAVVSPSFGMGWWRQPQAEPALERTLAWIEAQPDLDGERVVISGLSNGGPGVQRAVLAFPGRWDGVVFLNAVMDSDRLFAVAEAAEGIPILVVTGDAERRIPVEITREWARSMAMVHPRVRLEVFGGEDHFLLFSQPEAVMELLGAWVVEDVSGSAEG